MIFGAGIAAAEVADVEWFEVVEVTVAMVVAG